MRDETTKASALSVTCSRSHLTVIFSYLPRRADERLQLALLSNQNAVIDETKQEKQFAFFHCLHRV